MAWRDGVICREREIDIECYYVLVRVWGRGYTAKPIMNITVFEDLAEANLESLLRVTIN